MACHIAREGQAANLDGAVMGYQAVFNQQVYPTLAEDLAEPGTKSLKEHSHLSVGKKPCLWIEVDAP